MTDTKPLLNRTEVEKMTGLSRATLYREITQGRFPKQRQIAPGRVAWLREEIDTWIEGLAAA